jgi:hypothetical protein
MSSCAMCAKGLFKFVACPTKNSWFPLTLFYLLFFDHSICHLGDNYWVLGFIYYLVLKPSLMVSFAKMEGFTKAHFFGIFAVGYP